MTDFKGAGTAQKYEYLVVLLGDEGAYQSTRGGSGYGHINDLGRMGWELVAVVQSRQIDFGYFKRLIVEGDKR